jgi:hypothetical protein
LAAVCGGIGLRYATETVNCVTHYVLHGESFSVRNCADAWRRGVALERGLFYEPVTQNIVNELCVALKLHFLQQPSAVRVYGIYAE